MAEPAAKRPRTLASAAAQKEGAPDVFSLGPHTLSVSRGALHGKLRAKLVAGMKEELGAAPKGLIVLKGGEGWPVYSTDMDMVFRQESYFHYAFGVELEGWCGAIDVESGRSMLFMPKLPAEYAVWMGEIKQPPFYKAAYAVDEVHFIDDMASVINGIAPPCVHVLKGVNTDSDRATLTASVEGLAEGIAVEDEALFKVATECRTVKTQEELEIQEYVNQIGSRAHIAMMQAVKPGMMEYQLESRFMHTSYSEGGCRNVPYTPISASGANAAVLHYGHAGAPNNRQMKAGEMVLCDMGCEYHRYGSDITTTFPVDGKFTDDQMVVYNAVLDAHRAVLAAVKPGVAWPDMHRLGEKCILAGLTAAGLLKGDVDAMVEARVGAVFMPHGLGHLIGIDTHDVGGYSEGTPNRSALPGLKSLRTARVLAEGMVMTVEPGCYFNSMLIAAALENPAQKDFFVPDVIKRFEGSGGVRLEDNFVVTATGVRSFTDVPRSVEDVEAVMAGASWPRA